MMIKENREYVEELNLPEATLTVYRMGLAYVFEADRPMNDRACSELVEDLQESLSCGPWEWVRLRPEMFLAGIPGSEMFIQMLDMIEEYTDRLKTAEAACRKAEENATLLMWAMDRGETVKAYDLAKEIRSTCKAVFGETVGEP